MLEWFLNLRIEPMPVHERSM